MTVFFHSKSKSIRNFILNSLSPLFTRLWLKTIYRRLTKMNHPGQPARDSKWKSQKSLKFPGILQSLENVTLRDGLFQGSWLMYG